MRKRLTKKADPYTLGRDRENPPVEKYMTGDPSTWAEDVHPEHRWEDDTREETGHPGPNKKEKDSPEWPKMAKEHALKSAKELKAKAINCVRIAGYMFPKASETELETIGFNLMELSDRAIQATLEQIDKNEKTAGSDKDEVGAELRELVARTKKLVAEAEEEKEEEEEEASEDDEDEEEMSEHEKEAAVLTKKAKVLVAEAELAAEEGKTAAAEEKKTEAKKLLAKAKKLVAGPSLEVDPSVDAGKQKVMPPAAEEDEEEVKEEKKEAAAAAPAPAAKKAAEPAPKFEPTPMNKELSDSKIPAALKDKKEAALRHLEAAKALMAEAEQMEGVLDDEHPAEKSVHEGAHEADEAAEEIPPELQANADKMKEKAHGGEAAEGDVDAPHDTPQPEGQQGPGTSAEVHKMNQGEGISTAAEGEDDMGMGDIDMVPSEHDEELDDLFMSPDMKEAQEAYDEAFGKDADKEASVSKTASTAKQPKKGAKTLGAGVKVSASSGADDLSSLWDCPPDVSHIFKN